MKNLTAERSEQIKPVNICLYACIPQKEEFKRRHYPFRERVKGILKNAFNSLRTRVTGRLHFEFYSYMAANALGDNSNRGDMAIRMAIQAQLRSSFAPRPINVFEVDWRKLTDENISYINQHADLFVIGGGGYISVNGDGTAGTLLAESGRLSKLDCPIIAFGIGLNRMMHETTCSLSELRPEAQDNLRQLSQACREIGVRDWDTAELFARYGGKQAAVIGDPVLYFDDVDRPSSRQAGPLRIGVNLVAHGWRGYSVLKPMLPTIIGNLMRVRDTYKADLVYFLHHDFERPIVNFLRQKGLRLKVVDGSAAQLIDAYKDVDFVVNQMLHSCIFAANAGVPFLNLAYDEKCLAFCSLLDIPECAVEHSQVTEELLAKKFDQLFSKRHELSQRILHKKALLRSEYHAFSDEVIALIAERERR